MECNKDEAFKAKDLAEIKMRNGDFVGAQRFLLKAQRLFPDLDNISQLLTVCNVHCSAQNNANGSDLDWYGILQVGKTVDDATIKRQYRKLALLLHPDKNKSAGAEAAFKLIGEANRVLSDPGKRSMYDMKVRVTAASTASKAPIHQVNKKSSGRAHPRGPSAANPTPPNSQFKGSYVPKSMPPNSSGGATFWTCCPVCNIRYQYYRDILHKTLRCQNCLKAFTAYELDAPAVPQNRNYSQPAHCPWKAFSTDAPSKPNAQSSSWKPPTGAGVSCSRPVPNTGSTGDSRPLQKTESGRKSESAGRSDNNVDTKGDAKGSATTSKPDGVNRGKAPVRLSRKRKRNSSTESCESSETVESEDGERKETFRRNSSEQTSGLNGGHGCRRSSRNKKHVSYNENVNGDFLSPSKVSKVGKSCSANKEEIKENGLHHEFPEDISEAMFGAAAEGAKEELKEKTSVPIGESLPKGNSEGTEVKINGKEAEARNNTKSEISGTFATVPEMLDCPDPDFSDFTKDKADNCYAVDQLWAIYDNRDGMPRYYARISKVYTTPGFKLRITWLEPNPDDEDEYLWFQEELPVACGRYKIGHAQDTVDRLMFSHLVVCERSVKRSYVIYPRKGEIWAIFKNWDMRWRSEPEKHADYEYEIVEVLTDFHYASGINVVYLEKISGFISLFQQTTLEEGVVGFTIPSKELFRFSHQIPAFKMTGTEGEGVPKGSVELDPAALPLEILDRGRAGDVMEMGSKGVNSKLNGTCSKSLENDVRPRMCHEGTNTPKKNVGMQGKNENNERTFRPRRSPRHL